MKTSLLINAGLLLALLGAACSRPGLAPEEVTPVACPDLPVPPNGPGRISSGPARSYHLPCFNPRNPQELAFCLNDAANPAATGVYIGNLATRQQRLIWPGAPGVHLGLSWSSRGWLAFSRDDQVWKIKSNGDSLTQLTFGPPHYGPQWSPDGLRFVCRLPNDPVAPLLLFDHRGRQLARLRGYPTGYAKAWSPDGHKLLVEYGGDEQGYGLGVYDLTTDQSELLVPSDVAGSAAGLLTGAAWLPDSRTVVWAAGTGLYRTDTHTRQTRQLHPGCGTRTYTWPGVAADGRTIVVTRVDRRSLNDEGTRVYVERNLWLMDADGSNERKLEF